MNFRRKRPKAHYPRWSGYYHRRLRPSLRRELQDVDDLRILHTPSRIKAEEHFQDVLLEQEFSWTDWDSIFSLEDVQRAREAIRMGRYYVID